MSREQMFASHHEQRRVFPGGFCRVPWRCDGWVVLGDSASEWPISHFPVPLGKGGRQGNKQSILASQHNKGRSRPHRDGVKKKVK